MTSIIPAPSTLSLRLVNQSSAQRNKKATAHDRRAMAAGIRIHQMRLITIAIRASQAQRSAKGNGLQGKLLRYPVETFQN
jgi:hypothetical protein